MAVTLQQKAIDVIGHLPEDKIIQVIQFAEFLSFDKKPQREKAYSKEISKDGYQKARYSEKKNGNGG